MATTLKKQNHPPSVDAACSVVPVGREVINDQLLVALDDKSKVAIIADENDLKILIDALHATIGISLHERKNRERERMIHDLKQLKQAAFGGSVLI